MQEDQSASVTEDTNEGAGVETGGTEQATASTADNQTLLETVTGTGDGNAGENTKEADTNEEQSKEKEKQDEGAPEQYEEFKAPEGLQYDTTVISNFKDVAKELNLSQDKAQVLLDKMAPVIARQQLSRIQEISADWREKTLKDAEIGGDKWTRAEADIARVRDKFAIGDDGNIDPDIAEFMKSPAGNHPGVLKLLARVGRAFGEADFPKGTPDNEFKPTAADFYNQTKGR